MRVKMKSLANLVCGLGVVSGLLNSIPAMMIARIGDDA
jgi:hypothetical protein